MGIKLSKVVGHNDIVMTVDFSDCGNYVITGARDHKVRIQLIRKELDYKFRNPKFKVDYKFNSLILESIFIYHTDWVTSTALSKDGSWLLTGGRDKRAVLFNVLSGNKVIE